MVEKFDAVIIGSGAGGAPVAWTLAKKGLRVLVLEKGPLLLTQDQAPDGRSDFKRDELYATGPEKRLTRPGLANTGVSYFGSHVEPDLNDEPHIYLGADGRDRATIEGYTAQVVGGGTQLYGAVSLRFAPLDFRLRSFNEGRTDLREDPAGDVKREARDWPITYEELEPFYCQAEELIGINGTSENQAKPFSRTSYQRPMPPNDISEYARVGMELLGRELARDGTPMLPYRTPVAVITEDHAPSGRKASDPRTGFVNRYGCPLGLKSNTWVALLHPLVKAGLDHFELRPNCAVTHLECDGSRVTRVHYRDPAGAPRVVEGKVVVVACSAIETVRLLEISARESVTFNSRINHNNLLGKYFLTHCFGGAEALMEGRFDKSISLDSDWAIDCCATEDFLQEHGLWAGGAMYNNTSDQALPISLARTHESRDMDSIWQSFLEDTGMTGDALMRFIEGNLGKRLSISFMANQVPLATNRIELHPEQVDKWRRPVAYIIKDWHRHDRYLMDVLADHCARVLRYGGDPVGRKWPVEGQGGVGGQRERIANHILGGARFGADPTDSVLDPLCRAWHFDNLYVTDGSFMPTSGSANPTLTIQANAFRIADHLARHFL